MKILSRATNEQYFQPAAIFLYGKELIGHELSHKQQQRDTVWQLNILPPL